ncbi:MAG TPA: aminotransferase class V-fold PLP-dependent enzyme [Actinomycetales bacterium]|nr:aminotransferase class V-fold PLP-dependent enzyme [Actinomycetales bacterium]
MTTLSAPTSAAPTPEEELAASFDPAPGFLNAATMGLPPRRTKAALSSAVEQWAAGQASAAEYDLSVTRARELYARLVGVDQGDVAVGSQTSVTAGMVAASLPDGANVICVDGDFTSMVFPFLAQAGRGVTVQHVPLERLAESIDRSTNLVAFSMAQSSDGRIADGVAVAAAARAHGAMTFADVTQSAGWLPLSANDYDVTVCSSYKWLCCPRGVAFTTVTPEARERLRPVNAGWYAGESIWDSCYGPQMQLADSARRFDVAPVWLSFVGSVPSLELMVSLTPQQRSHGTRLADALRGQLSLAPEGRPVLSLSDPDGELQRRLVDGGCTVAARAGKVRIAFHLWNTERDVDVAARALTA